MPASVYELVKKIRRGRPTDWLEGLGLDRSIVRSALFSSFATEGNSLKWASKRLSFEGAPDLFAECLRCVVRANKLETLRALKLDIGEGEWRQILEKDSLHHALCHGPPAMLDWLETKGVDANFWQENIEYFINEYTTIRLSSAEWLLQKGVTLHDNAVETVCWLAIMHNNVGFLRMIKARGYAVRPTFRLMRALVTFDAETSSIAETLEFSLADLSRENLKNALFCSRPNVLRWLAKENITPQQCREVNGANFAMKCENTDCLEWLWSIGLTLDEFARSAQKHAPRETHPKVHAWLKQKEDAGLAERRPENAQT